MRTPRHPLVSFILATRDRRAVVEDTIGHVHRCGLDRGDYELIVVDNGSRDGTAPAIRERCDTVLRTRRNLGSCAKAAGVTRARGRFVVFLDDDSFPWPGSIERMLGHFERDERLGAAGFRVHLPNGEEEGAALPHVFVGCGVGFRTHALRHCGGLDPTFFMQAEEYDLAFRLTMTGWTVRVFHDLHVTHLKTDRARKTQRTTYYDIRNNLRVMARYLPASCRRPYRADCLQRYRWLAERAGHVKAHRRGVVAGTILGAVERPAYRCLRLSAGGFDRFFGWNAITSGLCELATRGARTILFADLGKNAYAFARAARIAGLEIKAVGDDRFHVPGRHYRGIPVEPQADAIRHDVDAIVVTNSAPIHGQRTLDRLKDLTSTPVLRFGDPQTCAGPPHDPQPAPPEARRSGRAGRVTAAGVQP